MDTESLEDPGEETVHYHGAETFHLHLRIPVGVHLYLVYCPQQGDHVHSLLVHFENLWKLPTQFQSFPGLTFYHYFHHH